MTLPEDKSSAQQLSNCHQAPLEVSSGDEGTSYYVCSQCHEAADPYVADQDFDRWLTNTFVELDNWYRRIYRDTPTGGHEQSPSDVLGAVCARFQAQADTHKAAIQEMEGLKLGTTKGESDNDYWYGRGNDLAVDACIWILKKGNGA
jgi:hypothetical protein